MNLILKPLVLTLFSFLLAACGGGGGGSDGGQVASDTASKNSLPIATAGDDFTVTEHGLVVLSGSASYDPDGEEISYSWRQTDGPEVVLSSDSAITPNFQAPAADQSLTYELVVNDGQDDSAPDTVTISVVADVNEAPIADVGSQQSVVIGSSVALNGSGSYDPEGNSLSYFWTQTNGPNVDLSASSAEIPTFTAPMLADTLSFTLIVSDGVKLSEPATVNIHIVAPTVNRAPISVAGTDQIIASGSAAALDGSASYDPDGDALSYQWLQTSGTTVVLNSITASMPSFTAPNTNEILSFELLVSDGNLTSLADQINIAVSSLNQEPVANAGQDQFAHANGLVTLDGSASVDPEGDSLNYQWQQTAGTTVTLNSSTSARPNFTSPNGTENLSFALVVNDGELSSPTDSVSISVSADDIAPVANAGVDQIVAGEALVFLDASASYDAEGDALSYQWQQTSGTTVTLSSTTAIAPSFTAPSASGNLSFSLVVNDGELSSPVDNVTITVSGDNLPPIADAGVDQTVAGNDLVTLDGSNSGDPNDDVLSYQWLQTSGTVVALSSLTDATPNFLAPNTDGSYSFSLVVSDGEFSSLADEVIITVAAANQPPVAAAGADQTVDGLSLVTLDGRGSQDPDGDALSYQWQQTSGTAMTLSSLTEAQPSFTAPNVNENYSFSLVVSDGEFSSLVDEVSISVSEINELPLANAGPDQTVEGLATVTLDGTASADPEGAVLAYTWLQTSGPDIVLSAYDNESPTFVAFAEAGIVSFSLLVNDGIDDSIADVVTIVIDGVNNVPVANAGVDRYVNNNSVVTLRGSNSLDADGDTLSYQWTQISGVDTPLNATNIANPTFTAIDDGELLFSLVVSDGESSSAADTILVTVGTIPVTNTKVNGTGITWGANYPSGNNDTCIGESVEYQDCYYGRELTHNDDSDGRAGFSYIKVSSNGTELAADASEWDCVKDQVTGSVWEVKKGGNDIVGDEGTHDADDLFNWYNSDPSSNGGGEGFADADGETCSGYAEEDAATYCNTQAYATRVNQETYCGYNDWRLPTRKELLSLVDYGVVTPMIETNYFPLGGQFVWSATPVGTGTKSAWGVYFDSGGSRNLHRSNSGRVRLLRSDP